MITVKLGEEIKEPIAIALGTFDGLHMGHMAVINHALSSGYKSAVISFFPKSPREILTGEAQKTILSDEKKREKLQKMGINYQILIDFAEIKSHSPEEFIDELLSYYDIKLFCCGYDFRFGKGGEGDAGTLRNICEKRGIDSFAAHEVKVNGETCSSSKIREYIASGDVTKAEKMLG